MQIQGPNDLERPHFPLYHLSLGGGHLRVVGGRADGQQPVPTLLRTALRVQDPKSALVAGPEGGGGDSM